MTHIHTYKKEIVELSFINTKFKKNHHTEINVKCKVNTANFLSYSNVLTYLVFTHKTDTKEIN